MGQINSGGWNREDVRDKSKTCQVVTVIRKDDFAYLAVLCVLPSCLKSPL